MICQSSSASARGRVPPQKRKKPRRFSQEKRSMFRNVGPFVHEWMSLVRTVRAPSDSWTASLLSIRAKRIESRDPSGAKKQKRPIFGRRGVQRVERTSYPHGLRGGNKPDRRWSRRRNRESIRERCPRDQTLQKGCDPRVWSQQAQFWVDGGRFACVLWGCQRQRVCNLETCPRKGRSVLQSHAQLFPIRERKVGACCESGNMWRLLPM